MIKFLLSIVIFCLIYLFINKVIDKWNEILFIEDPKYFLQRHKVTLYKGTFLHRLGFINQIEMQEMETEPLKENMDVTEFYLALLEMKTSSNGMISHFEWNLAIDFELNLCHRAILYKIHPIGAKTVVYSFDLIPNYRESNQPIFKTLLKTYQNLKICNRRRDENRLVCRMIYGCEFNPNIKENVIVAFNGYLMGYNLNKGLVQFKIMNEEYLFRENLLPLKEWF